MKSVKVQLVGGYYIESLGLRSFFPDNIHIDKNVRTGISPFTYCGKVDGKLMERLETNIKDIKSWNINKGFNLNLLHSFQTRMMFELRKNFKNCLSRNAEDFCDNTINKQPGEEVKLANDTDYIVIDNSAIIYDLIQYNGSLYTLGWPNTPLIDFLRQQPSSKIFSPAMEEDFNWKYYFDMYIDAILEAYDSSRIILIKTQYSNFYYKNNELKYFPEINKNKMKLIEKADDYFISRTNCTVIDMLTTRIPTNPAKGAWPYGNELGKWQMDVIARITDVINYGEIRQYSLQNKRYSAPLAAKIAERVRSDQQMSFSELFYQIEEKRIPSIHKLINYEEIRNLDSTRTLSLLYSWLKNEDMRLWEYVVSCTKYEQIVCDNELIKLIEKYTEFFVCDFNDIMNIYKLYTVSNDKKNFANIAKNIVSQKDSVPIQKSENCFKKNIEYLRKYEWINQELPAEISDEIRYIQIQDDIFLVICTESDDLFYLSEDIISSSFDYMSVIENNYQCPVKYANALTYSYDYYIEKFRRGDGEKPTYLRFINEKEFCESLYYIDYKSLLVNENFVFLIGEKYVFAEEYKPIVNLTDLFDPNVVVVKIFSGLGDQLCYYILGRMIEKYGKRKILFDDLRCIIFGGLEISKFTSIPLNLLSEKLSPRLKLFNRLRIYINLISKCSSHSIYVTNAEARYKENGYGNNLLLVGNNEKLKYWIMSDMPYMYFDMLIRIEQLMMLFDFRLHDFIKFPPLKKEDHMELAEKMRTCDSVVIHIRKGDYVSLGWDTDNEYYCEAIQKVMNLKEYVNKKFFVFSDDIKWCKENMTQVGLDKVDPYEVIFVEGNKGEESYRDLQLMSLGKIMIIGLSYFPVVAAIYNRNLKIMLCANTQRNNIFRKIYKNMPDLGAFSKDYNPTGHL